MTGPKSPSGERGGVAGRTVSDRVLGWIGGGMVVAALLLLLFGGPGDAGGTGASGGVEPPGLALVSPADGASVGELLELVFSTDAPITTLPGGWGRDGYHIHAEVNGREVMPGTADIRRQADGSYRWAVGRMPEGEVSVRLYWSDEAHRPIEAGGTERVRVRR